MNLSLLALGAVIAIVAVFQWRLSREAREIRRSDGLTLKDLQEFRLSYAGRRSRHAMPERFTRFAAATDRTRVWHILALLIIAGAIFAYIFIGPWP